MLFTVMLLPLLFKFVFDAKLLYNDKELFNIFKHSIISNINISMNFKVMLLSLGAGGVGLNLVGANHLFLLDMHWNPQLESQACDRIYRVGQTRPVYIHR